MEEINLKVIIDRYPKCLNDRKKLKGLIKDLYPGCSLGLVNVLVGIIDTNIMDEIRREDVVTDMQANRWKDILENIYGYSPKFLMTAIDLWHEAFHDESTKIDDGLNKAVDAGTNIRLKMLDFIL